ncbi:MAG: proton-conducting transporter membrane subunit, partial [Chloroflexota bacterium]|nr:proton-conducting transporter membrane subunit [Chloroflexota bacterium]
DSTQLLIIFSLILIISGFSFKIASFPFFTWVPDVYQGSPSLVTLYLSVVSKIAGFSILIRFLFESVNIEVYSNISLFIAIISSISMFYGNIMALRQNDLKRLFAYSTIAHAGYILIGIASLQVNDASFSGINSTVFYLIAYGITNLTAFLSMISLSRYVDSYNMLDFKGIGSAQRYQSIIFSISLISLLGIPATVGFMGKAFIFSGAISNDYFWLASFGIINSLISAYYYMKVIKIIFVEKSDKSFPEITFPRLKVITTIGAILIIVLGLAPVALLSIVESALNTII